MRRHPDEFVSAAAIRAAVADRQAADAVDHLHKVVNVEVIDCVGCVELTSRYFARNDSRRGLTLDWCR